MVNQEYETGHLEQGEAYLRKLIEPGDLLVAQLPPITVYEIATVIPVVGRIAGSSFLLELAESAANRILSSSWAVPLFRIGANLGLALIAVYRSDQRLAADQNVRPSSK